MVDVTGLQVDPDVVGTGVFVRVCVAVLVATTTCVGVRVGETPWVGVRVGVFEMAGVSVRVGVRVLVKTTPVGDGVLVFIGVDEITRVGVAVSVVP